MLKNTPERYGTVAKFLHWTMAALILFMLGLGLYMDQLEPSPATFKLYALHKSIGIVVLVLACVRLGWRLGNINPAPIATHKSWERLLARLVHPALYLAMFLMPLSGWLMSSAKGFTVSVFNSITLPNLVAPNDELAKFAADFHGLLAYVLIALIALHVSGALKHHMIDRDATLRRMLPWGRA